MRRAPPPGRALPIRRTLPGGRAWLALLCSVLALGFVTPAWADQTYRRLDDLFERLRVTSIEAEAEASQQQIWQIWIESDDILANRLMQNGIQAMVTQQHALALEYFDRLVERAPAFAEGWNKRATVYYLMEN